MGLSSTPVDYSAMGVTCEACGSTVHKESGAPLTIGNSYSIVACWATTGGEPAPGAGVVSGGVQCDAEQHYGCCQECAIAAHIECVQSHMVPKMQAARAAQAARARVLGGEVISGS